MTLTMGQGVIIQKLLSLIKDTKAPIKVAYKLAQFSDELDSNLKFYEEKMRQIINEYAEKDEKGNPKVLDGGASIEIKSGCVEICQQEFNELSGLKFDVKDYKFTLDELEVFELSIEDLKILMPFIKVDEE